MRVDYWDVVDYIVHGMVVGKCDGAVGNAARLVAAAAAVAAVAVDNLDYYCAERIAAVLGTVVAAGKVDTAAADWMVVGKKSGVVEQGADLAAAIDS